MSGCILSKFYIKPQRTSAEITVRTGCILSKFYIKPQLRSQANRICRSCILSKFYIKPQLRDLPRPQPRCCILSKFYIKPQQISGTHRELVGCILSKFYIKPQLAPSCSRLKRVVSYRNSTSNHNSGVGVNATMSLYLIEILHQTTTQIEHDVSRAKLYLIEILHQTTTSLHQQFQIFKLYLIEILHQTTTVLLVLRALPMLYLIEILHQTTTDPALAFPLDRCILSKFYIKPQLVSKPVAQECVVSYRNSTSNHNASDPTAIAQKLYLIEILHQTTTKSYA